MCDLACNERFGDHANHLATCREHRVCDLAHQADICAAINQSEATLNEGDSRLASGPKVFWAQT